MITLRGSLRCLAIVTACVPFVSHAQAPLPERPAYTLERYDEDWSFLRDPAKLDGVNYLGRSASIILAGALTQEFCY